MRISDWSSDVCSSDLCNDQQCDRAERAPASRNGPISAATGSANPRRRIWPSARERQSAMLIVTGTDETRQGSVGAQRRKSSGPAGRRQLLPQLALSPHFDYKSEERRVGEKGGK